MLKKTQIFIDTEKNRGYNNMYTGGGQINNFVHEKRDRSEHLC